MTYPSRWTRPLHGETGRTPMTLDDSIHALRLRVMTRAHALDRYLEFYNHCRPHLGYRTQGRPPAEIFSSRRRVHEQIARH